MAQRAHTRMVALDAFELLVNSTAHVLEQLAFQCAAETQHCTVFTALGFLQARQIEARGQFDFECYPPPVQRSGVCAAVFGIAPNLPYQRLQLRRGMFALVRALDEKVLQLRALQRFGRTTKAEFFILGNSNETVQRVDAVGGHGMPFFCKSAPTERN